MATSSLAMRSRVRPRLVPVVVWASLGALNIGLAAYVWVNWALSTDFAATLPPTPITDPFVRGALGWAQGVCSAAAVVCILVWVLLPKLRTGHFSFMGLLCLASTACYWVDPMSNYYSFGLAYSSGLRNFGSWANFIPGYSFPGMQRFPESPFLIGTTYVWFNVLFPLMFAALWRWLDRRFPQWGFATVFIGLLIAMGLFDLFQELFYLRLQIYSYVGAPQAWCLFAGHYYQFPLFIAVVTAFFFMGMTLLIYSRDDKGQSFAERGLDRLTLTPSAQTLVRFLALCGACWVVVMVTYFIPVQWMYTHGDSIPADTPAHLRNDLCGTATGPACPGRGIPIARRD